MKREPELDGHDVTDTDTDALASLPNGVKLSWGLVKPSTRGPKGELSISKIVEAAIAIADREGLAAVSMNKVAASLGFTAMSLYRYISSKEDLLLLMQDAICEEAIPLVEAGEDWRECMRKYVEVAVNLYLEHPWFGDIPITSVPLSPNHLKIVDLGLRPLRNLPLDDYEKMSIVLLVSSYARTVGIISSDFNQAIRQGKSEEAISGSIYAPALQLLINPDRFPDLHPIMMSGAYTGDHPEEDTVGDVFDFGLERVLDGIETYLAKRNGGGQANMK